MLGSSGAEFARTKEICIAGVSIKLAGRASDSYFKNIEHEIEKSIFLALAAKSVLKGPGCIIDIGANIGMTAALLAKVRLDDKIYAIEPSARAFHDLTRTISENNLGNVRAVNIGLGAKAGRLVLNEDPSNSSAANFSNEVSSEEDDLRGVNVQTLDDFCSSHDLRPHLLKIDVEGFELNVLRGASRVMRESQPVIFIEMNSFTTLAYGRVSPLDLLEFIRKNFNEVLWVNHDKIERIDDDASLIQFLHVHYSRNSGIDDLLCVPHGLTIDMDALRSEFKKLRPKPSSASARLEAVLNSTTWKMAKNIQRLAKPLKGIQRLIGGIRKRSEPPT